MRKTEFPPGWDEELKRADLAEHFKEKDWYDPYIENRMIVDTLLNDKERAVAHYILFFQRKHGLLFHNE